MSMFCPGCGVEEKQPIQFCRSCGSSFRGPGEAMTAATSAREEIGRAMAEKIRELNSAHDLKKIAEDVLPEIEKFLESPAEKRLRRIRKGTIISAIGLGGALGFFALAAATRNPDVIFLSAAGLITFLIGIAFVINGYLLSVPHEKNASLANSPADSLGSGTSDLRLSGSEPPSPFRSVTESTTTHLADKIRR